MTKLVKERLNERVNVNDWIMRDIEDTMAAYGLTEIERDKILNDPDVEDMILDMIQHTQSEKDLELVALKVMQYANDEGIIANEMTNEDWRGEYEGDTPADQGSRAARKENYKRLEKQDRLDVLEPLAVAIKGVLNRLEDFDTEFIDQMTDMWFLVNKEIGKNS